jgi:hypothetical protein
MTGLEMHRRIGQYLDTVGSPRFPGWQVDNAINSTIGMIVEDRYMPVDPKQRENSFQTNQRIRDNLRPLVKTSSFINANGSIIPLISLTDYRYLASMTVKIDGVEYPTIPATYDEWDTILKLDPFMRPTLEEPVLIYRIENSTGIEIKWGATGTLNSGKITYIKNPLIVSTIGTIVNTDLPLSLHDDICRGAAELLKGQNIKLSAQRQGGQN